MVFEFDFGEPVEDFTSSGTHVSVWTTEFGEHVRYKERFHHAQNWRTLFGDDVGY